MRCRVRSRRCRLEARAARPANADLAVAAQAPEARVLSGEAQRSEFAWAAAGTARVAATMRRALGPWSAQRRIPTAVERMDERTVPEPRPLQHHCVRRGTETPRTRMGPIARIVTPAATALAVTAALAPAAAPAAEVQLDR